MAQVATIRISAQQVDDDAGSQDDQSSMAVKVGAERHADAKSCGRCSNFGQSQIHDWTRGITLFFYPPPDDEEQMRKRSSPRGHHVRVT